MGNATQEYGIEARKASALETASMPRLLGLLRTKGTLRVSRLQLHITAFSADSSAYRKDVRLRR